MAVGNRNTLSSISIMLTRVQRHRLETAARSTGVSPETFALNTLTGAAESIEASDRRELRLLILLLSGATWEAISKAMDMPIESLRRAGTILATQMFRGDRYVA
jgi:uncharacterized protein (DUF1778 family)